MWEKSSAEAQPWRIGYLPALLHLGSPIIVLCVGALVWLFDRELMRDMVAEDGVIEWTQVACFTVAAILSVRISQLLYRSHHVLAAWLFALLALGLTFIIGEELAWGQRILGFETPEGLSAINEKQEVSLHNVESVTHFFTLAKLLVGIYGTFGGWLLPHVRSKYWAGELRFVVVPLFLSTPFAIVLGMRLLRLTVMTGDVPIGFAELEELILAYGMASFVTMVWLRLRSREPTSGN